METGLSWALNEGAMAERTLLAVVRARMPCVYTSVVLPSIQRLLGDQQTFSTGGTAN